MIAPHGVMVLLKPLNRLKETVDYKYLKRYLPLGSESYVCDLIKALGIHFEIKAGRKSKMGDFRPPYPPLHKIRISVNKELGKNSFLITTIHEIAHAIVWTKYKGKVKPHGKEWKAEYGKQLFILIERGCFPEEIREMMVQHALNPPSSSAYDIELVKKLNELENPESLTLDDLEDGQLFTVHGKRVFLKGKLRRTMFLCSEQGSKKKFLIHKSARVKIVDN